MSQDKPMTDSELYAAAVIRAMGAGTALLRAAHDGPEAVLKAEQEVNAAVSERNAIEARLKAASE